MEEATLPLDIFNTHSLVNDLIPGNSYDIILFPFTDIIVFPNENLPLRIKYNQYKDIINYIETNSSNYTLTSHIGIINNNSYNNENHSNIICGTLSRVTTCYVLNNPNELSYPTNLLADNSIAHYAIHTQGQYRFHIENTWTWNTLRLATVVILHETCGLPRHLISSNNSNSSNSIHPFPLWVSIFNRTKL